MTSSRMKFVGAAAFALSILVGCTSGQIDAELATPAGAPSIDLAAVDAHGQQFDSEVPDRVAGSQQEGVASAYLLGHMQQAGYLVRLDAVPVKDLVRSTNVVAMPPSGADPTAAVIAVYNTPPGRPASGANLGLWLELARSLNVREPEHTVMFVAVGAGDLGQLRLARFLEEEELDPTIVEIDLSTLNVAAGGPLAEALEERIDGDVTLGAIGPCGRAVDGETERAACDPLGAAGFEHTVVLGSPAEIGPAVLGYLAEEHS